MMTASKANKSQSDKFKEAARELGADQDEERFNENLRRIAKAKPKDNEKDGDNAK